MKCIDCGEKETRTSNTKRCSRCCVSLWYKRNPEKYAEMRRRLRERQKQGETYYGGNGIKALIRDNFKCQSCRKNKNEVKRLEIHHIDGNGSQKPYKERNNKLENLITLCSPCHSMVEISRRGHPAVNAKSGKWAIRFEKCISCGTTEKKHICHGLCTRCFANTRREYAAEYFRKHYSKAAKSGQASSLGT